MPTLTSIEYPRPSNWQDFENLCRDLWSRIWNDPNAQQNGRQRQPQHGVDVFGNPDRGAEWAGVQCKLKKRGSLSRKVLEDEVRKASAFNPALSSFILATAAPRDAGIQEAAREITDEQRRKGAFTVAVFAWEDICQELAAHPDLVRKHYPQLEVGPPAAATRHDYLTAVWSRWLPVPLLGLASGHRGDDVPLSAVYTALDVTAEVAVYYGSFLEHLWKSVRPKQSAQERPTYKRRCTALEAAAAAPRLVLKGAPGSGKSTFARYLALSLAGDALGKSEANLRRLNGLGDETEPAAEDLPWPHRALLPIFVELKALVRSEAFPGEDESGDASHLLAFLETGAFDPEAARFAPLLREALRPEGEGCLLILDGLDETPAAEASRERLRQVISSWTRRYPHCRVLVTSRPYAYEEGSPWRLDGAGFEEAGLAPFDEAKIGAYVSSWYALLADRGQIGHQQAKRQGRDLEAEIRSTSHLRPLAERPLMLSMMADLHASGGGRFRGGRAELYEGSVKLLLDRWNELQDIEGATTVAQLLGMDVGEIRRALEHLAYDVQRQRGQAAGSEPAAITAAELWTALDRERSKERLVDERRVMDYLHQRSGILLAESPSRFRFPHRSFQEYLAACYLVETDFPDLLERTIADDPTLWREVALLVAGKQARTPFMVWEVLKTLVPEGPPAGVEPDDPMFLRALYAGLAVEENRLWLRLEEKYRERLERIRQWLERSLEVEALSPVDRASAGRVLGRLGDRRAGVGLRQDGLPDVDWVEIPAGAFLMGSVNTAKGLWDGTPQTEVEVSDLRISRYPVTNAQYGAFVEDGGYTPRWRHCWTQAGWNWKAIGTVLQSPKPRRFCCRTTRASRCPGSRPTPSAAGSGRSSRST